MSETKLVSLIIEIYLSGWANGQPTYSKIYKEDIKDALKRAIPIFEVAGIEDSAILNLIEDVSDRYKDGVSLY